MENNIKQKNYKQKKTLGVLLLNNNKVEKLIKEFNNGIFNITKYNNK